MRTLMTLALLPPVLLLGACGAPGPRFDLVGVRQVERTDDALVLEFDVAAVNRGRRELPLREARYTLDLGGAAAFKGRRVAAVSVPAFGRQVFTLPAVVDPAAIDLDRFDDPGETIPFRLRGEIEYLTPGQLAEVLFDTGLRRTASDLRLVGVFEIVDDAPPPLGPRPARAGPVPPTSEPPRTAAP